MRRCECVACYRLVAGGRGVSGRRGYEDLSARMKVDEEVTARL